MKSYQRFAFSHASCSSWALLAPLQKHPGWNTGSAWTARAPGVARPVYVVSVVQMMYAQTAGHSIYMFSTVTLRPKRLNLLQNF